MQSAKGGWEAAHPGGLFKGWDSVPEGLRGGEPAHGAREHQMMSWGGGAKGKHGRDMTVCGGVLGVITLAKFCPLPALCKTPSATCRDAGTESSGSSPSPAVGSSPISGGDTWRRPLSPLIDPRASGTCSRSSLVPSWGGCQEGISPSCPSCLPVPQEQTLPSISRSCSFSPGLDVKRNL